MKKYSELKNNFIFPTIIHGKLRKKTQQCRTVKIKNKTIDAFPVRFRLNKKTLSRFQISETLEIVNVAFAKIHATNRSHITNTER